MSLPKCTQLKLFKKTNYQQTNVPGDVKKPKAWSALGGDRRVGEYSTHIVSEPGKEDVTAVRN